MTGYRVSDVMTKQVVYLSADTTLDEAARVMRDSDIGDVVVTEGDSLAGMLTDRDIVVRAAERTTAQHQHRFDHHP
jgi:CBS domain-containing protein